MARVFNPETGYYEGESDSDPWGWVGPAAGAVGGVLGGAFGDGGYDKVFNPETGYTERVPREGAGMSHDVVHPDTFSPQQVALIEQGGRGSADWDRGDLDESGSQIFSNEAYQDAYAAPDPFAFSRPEFDPSAITGPYSDYTTAADEAYETYKGLLEGIATGPRTSRIEEMYGLALAEANRRGEAVDAWEATQGARLEGDFDAMGEQLGGLHEEFNAELDLIREASGERREGAKVEREARIDQVIADADLGEAAATFIVSSTATSDILDSQGTRQEAYDGRMDRLYAGVELDRVMNLAGMETQARRDLADEVLAMKGLVDTFRYEAGQERLGRLQVAEEGAAQREADMLTTLAELGYGHAGRMADVGLEGALAVAGAEDAFDTQWDEAEAYWSNPVTANAFMGVDPSLMAGAPPQQMFENWLDVLGTQDSGPSVGAPGDPVYWQDEQGSWWEIGTYGPAGQIVYDHTAISGISNPRDLSPQQLLQEIQRGILV